MKVLLLTRYQRQGASSRMRFMQYLPYIADAGIDVTVSPLFLDAYVAGLQSGRRDAADMARSYLRRLRILLSCRKYDLLWIEKESLPWLPARFEQALLSARIPYVLDYDDAVFHYYDQHRHAPVRRILGGKHAALMRGAALVVAGNAYLADFARLAGAGRVEVVPTAIDLERYDPCAIQGATNCMGPPAVGWIGQRATAAFLQPLVPVFDRLAAEGTGRFIAIGIDTKALGLPMDSIPWSERTEVDSIRNLDVGIMPLVDGPFERGKCGYKLIQYMACGLAVVASPVGVNRQIVKHGENGFLAETPAEWAKALETLLADVDLRQRMGRAGRQVVEREYCTRVTGPRLVELLMGVAALRAA